MSVAVVTLKKVEIAGFKSFAKRTTIEFTDGITAIVGPNGAGKSNLSDAIRWVFGEQKNRLLRSEKTEDLIYHGGKSKARASMAEVVITLNNSSSKVPLPLTEIEITRRLYRSGESNYLLNGKKVSLGYIQELLAKSGFGIGSYTVIGQGMIDQLILATGQQRKLLFEEASGIKQFEIKLTQTKRKLESTQKNLDQINNLLADLQPQHNLATSQIKLLRQRDNLEDKLDIKRRAYIGQELNRIADYKSKLGLQMKDKQTELIRTIQNLKLLESERLKSKQHNKNNQAEATALASELEKLETAREKNSEQINSLHSKLSQVEQELGPSDSNNIEEVEYQLQESQKLLEKQSGLSGKFEQTVNQFEKKIAVVDKKLKLQTDSLNQAKKSLSNSQKKEYLQHCLGLIALLQKAVSTGKGLSETEVIIFKLRRMIQHSLHDNAAELALLVGRKQNTISNLLAEREEITEAQTAEVIRLRACELDVASTKQAIEELRSQIASQTSSSDMKKLQKISAGLLAKIKFLEKDKLKTEERTKSLRKRLVEMAQHSDEGSNDQYLLKHEQLLTEKIQQDQSIADISRDLAELEIEFQDCSNLQKKWFGIKQVPITKSNIHTSLVEIQKLEAELDVMEEIDPMVQTDGQALLDRLNFLSSQKSDLEAALKNLQSVCRDTEKKMQTIFIKSFERINIGFNKSFKMIFGGGSAELSLNQEEDGQFGIDINVQLSSKRVQSLASLSGGEKAMASLALLAGILTANPSPFVVLDEVDAALDEENTQRFARILDNITEKSQLLVVTHNHYTMAKANELIGITSSPQSDSHILRVKLQSLPIAQ